MNTTTKREPAWRAGARGLLLHGLMERGPQTTAELANYCQMPANDLAPRMTELLNAGQVRDTGRRKSSLSGMGRKQIVWEAVQ